MKEAYQEKSWLTMEMAFDPCNVIEIACHAFGRCRSRSKALASHESVLGDEEGVW